MSQQHIEEDLPPGAMYDDREVIEDEVDDTTVDDWGDFQDVEIPEDEEDDEGADESFDQALKTVQLQKQREAPPQVRPTITKQPEVIDDFIRNFLVQTGLRETLETFESEWYHNKAKQEAAGEQSEPIMVPDVYVHNAQLTEKVTLLTEEVEGSREAIKDLRKRLENMKKQRDFHKLNHNRVMQEKGKLTHDVRRLQEHATRMEPMLNELRMKYESAMKERMLIKLDRDKLAAKVKTLEATVSKLERSAVPVEETTTRKKKTHAAGAQWPEERENPFLKQVVKSPSNMQTISSRSTLKGHSMTVTSVAVHPTKSIIATSSDDTSWKVWAVPSGEVIMSATGHKDWVSGVQFHPKGTHIATSSGDGTVKVWDIAESSCSHTFRDHTQGVWDVAWHYAGDFLASCSLDHTARIWDVTVGKARQALRGHVDSVNSVHFQPFANNIVTASGDKTVSLWDPNTGYCIHTFYGHMNAVNQAAFACKGDMLGSVDADGLLILWDMRMVGELARADLGPHPANGVAFDRSGEYVVVGSDDSQVHVYHIAEQKQWALRGHEDSVQAVCFGGDNTYFVTASADATARYWS